MKAFLSLLATAVLAFPAFAELEFCNSTDETASVAIGYKGAEGWTSEGWWNVEPGDCKTAVSGDLPLSHYYYRVESDAITYDHDAYMFCTSDEEFTIVGDTDCDARGFDREGFNEIDLQGLPAYTVDLVSETRDQEDTSGPSGAAALFEDVMRPSTDVDMPPSGTYGEPFTLTGTFSHCDVLDAGIECSFVVDDWVYTASSYHDTPQILLEDLYARELNSRLLFSGDMTGYQGSQAQIVLRTFANAGSDDFAGDRAAMQGFWTSTDDPDFQVMIYGSLYGEIYQGIPDTPTYMSFRDGCDGAPGNGVAFRLLSSDSYEDRCFFLSYVDGSSLELYYAGGTGSPLSFRRTD